MRAPSGYRWRGWAGRSCVALAAALVGGCAPPPQVVVMEAPLPPLRVEQVAEPGAAPAVAAERGERVTLAATDTELRALLTVLAEGAGVNLVVGPEVQGRVTVRLEDVPARDALEEVIRATGLMIVEPLRAPWGPTVFYVVPVNVNEADAALIQARFGVSPELARFLVRARAPLN
jgi:type II secretory pathway component GspD/PulD (secretin)